MVAADGGIFSFGDAQFLGSLGGVGFDDVVGMVATAPQIGLGGAALFVPSAERGGAARGYDHGRPTPPGFPSPGGCRPGRREFARRRAARR